MGKDQASVKSVLGSQTHFLVEICPNCGSLNVLKERTALTRIIKTTYYRCDGCGHEWRELVHL